MISNPFNSDSEWHPFRWFLVLAASLTFFMSYADYSGWRLMSFGGGPQQRGYYGGPSYHK